MTNSAELSNDRKNSVNKHRDTDSVVVRERIKLLMKGHTYCGGVLLVLGNKLFPSFATRFDVDNGCTVIWLDKEEEVSIGFVILCRQLGSLRPSWDLLGVNSAVKA